jgi:hypothetical protein
MERRCPKCKTKYPKKGRAFDGRRAYRCGSTGTYDVYCDRCGHLTAEITHSCDAQLSALREENERLRNELKRITKPGEDLHDWLIEGKIPRPEES